MLPVDVGRLLVDVERELGGVRYRIASSSGLQCARVALTRHGVKSGCNTDLHGHRLSLACVHRFAAHAAPFDKCGLLVWRLP